MRPCKYYYRVYDQNDRLIFDHSSNDPRRLLKLLAMKSHDSEGNMYCSFYFAKRRETNIPTEILEGD